MNPHELLASSLGDVSVPKLYANSYTVTFTGADVTFNFLYHGHSTAVVSIPFGVAKDILEKLSDFLAAIERDGKLHLPTVEEVTHALRPHAGFEERENEERKE